jgi:hypothetical protein
VITMPICGFYDDTDLVTNKKTLVSESFDVGQKLDLMGFASQDFDL